MCPQKDQSLQQIRKLAQLTAVTVMSLPLTDRVVDVEQYVVNVLTIWVTVVVPSGAIRDEVVPIAIVVLAADTVAVKATNAARIEKCIFDL